MRLPISIASVAIITIVSSCKESSVLPVASFITDADSYLVGDIVYFQSTCQDATSFEWDFKDGTGSSEENPTHVYTEEGKYTVSLVASNQDGSDEASKSLNIEMSYPCWTELASLNTARHRHFSVGYNNLVYVLSGKAEFSVEAYDPATNEWTFKANRPNMNGYPASCVMDDKVYFIGGGTIVDIYDLETDSWSEGPPLNTGRLAASAVSCNGKIYVFCGVPAWTGGNYISTMEIYDPATETWTEKSCPIQCFDLMTAEVNGKIYLFGGYYGYTDREALNTVYEYDTEADSWEYKSSMPTGRWGAACVVLDDLIYVIGGGLDYTWDNYSTTDCNIVEVYDPSGDTWESRSPMPVARTVCAACVLNDMIYVSGGAIMFSSSHDNFHVYDPACDAESN